MSTEFLSMLPILILPSRVLVTLQHLILLAQDILQRLKRTRHTLPPRIIIQELWSPHIQEQLHQTPYYLKGTKCHHTMKAGLRPLSPGTGVPPSLRLGRHTWSRRYKLAIPIFHTAILLLSLSKPLSSIIPRSIATVTITVIVTVPRADRRLDQGQ
jgi:hypothetical protein